MIWAILSVLVLHPVLDEPTDLRLVAVDTGDAEIHWYIDGVDRGSTRDGEALSVPIGAGTHRVEASTEHDGRWHAMARPEPRGPGAVHVQAWTATYEPKPSGQAAWPWEPAAAVALGVAAVVVLAWPTRSKHP